MGCDAVELGNFSYEVFGLRNVMKWAGLPPARVAHRMRMPLDDFMALYNGEVEPSDDQRGRLKAEFARVFAYKAEGAEY